MATQGWVCPWCDYYNEDDPDECGNCGQEKGTSPSGSSPEESDDD